VVEDHSSEQILSEKVRFGLDQKSRNVLSLQLWTLTKLYAYGLCVPILLILPTVMPGILFLASFFLTQFRAGR
jgi:hypothetical protein